MVQDKYIKLPVLFCALLEYYVDHAAKITAYVPFLFLIMISHLHKKSNKRQNC
jgi:hypothetical protein